MNKKYFMALVAVLLLGVLIFLAIVLGNKKSRVLEDNFGSSNIEQFSDQDQAIKEFSNELFSFKYSYPKVNSVVIENLQHDGSGSSPSYQGTIVLGGETSYVFSDFDPYKLKQNSYAGKYDYRTINNKNAVGILFWKSYGPGPYECYEEMNCDSYSDEFQFGYRFDLKDGTAVTFYNELNFNDGKNIHSIDEVLALDQYQELVEIIKTFEQK